jgi:hypothetical protein
LQPQVWQITIRQIILLEGALALIQHVALVSESNLCKMNDLLRVSAAMQKQASRDLAPIWDVSATVDVFAKLQDVPDGYWPMVIRDNIGYSAAGIHIDKDGQPFALIAASDSVDKWSLTASHEMCEMVVDPSGNRQETGDSPKPGQGRVSFLVEVCDPSEAADFAYSVNGILVSDFFTPNYFDPVTASGVRYSYTGAITAPRQVLRGGYLSWKDSVDGHWWQQSWFDGGAPTFRDIGARDAKSASIRGFVDRLTAQRTAQAIDRGRVTAQSAGLTVAQAQKSLTGNATMWRQQISEILGRPSTRHGSAKKVAKKAAPKKKA